MQRPLLIITGTPGTGKSTLARQVARTFGFDRLDLHHYYRLVSVGYDQKKRCFIVEGKKLERLVRQHLKKSKKGVVFDSHASHLLPRKMVDLCMVVTYSDLKKLKKRLQQRKYSQHKIRENLDAEIFQVCLMEAKAKRHKILVFDGSKKFDLAKIAAKLKKYF